MQPSFCAGVQPGSSVVAFLLRIAGRLAARVTAWYCVSPLTEDAAFAPPVTVGSLGAGLPSGPITFGSQS